MSGEPGPRPQNRMWPGTRSRTREETGSAPLRPRSSHFLAARRRSLVPVRFLSSRSSRPPCRPTLRQLCGTALVVSSLVTRHFSRVECLDSWSRVRRWLCFLLPSPHWRGANVRHCSGLPLACVRRLRESRPQSRCAKSITSHRTTLSPTLGPATQPLQPSVCVPESLGL